MKRRTVVRFTRELEREVGEAVRGYEAKRFAADANGRLLGVVAFRCDDREPVDRLDATRNAKLAQRRFERRRAHPAVTPLSTFRDPDRNPARSIATRGKPADTTALRTCRLRAGASHRSTSSRASSTRARSPW